MVMDLRVNFSDRNVLPAKKSIFLAGPTCFDTPFEQSWRRRAVNILNDFQYDGLVYVPEYQMGLINSNKREEQAYWEREAMDVAGVIVFWIPSGMKHYIGSYNAEFSRYLKIKAENVVYGHPKSVREVEYLDYIYDMEQSNGEIYRTLEDTLGRASYLGLFL